MDKEKNNNSINSENENELENFSEPEVFPAILKDLKVYIDSENSISLHEKGYYGSYNNEILELEPIEALLLLERKRLNIKNEEGLEYDFKSLSEFYVKRIQNFWTKFLVYKDLRSRGYIVRQGYGEDIEFRVYDRGAIMGESSAKYLIHPVIEGKPLNLNDLFQITKISQSSRKKLVLVVVDRQGETTFYECKKVLF